MNHFGQGRHFGVQARTFQVLAMTGEEKTFFFSTGTWVPHL